MATAPAPIPRSGPVARALGSPEALALGDLRRAPLRSRPQPSRLDAPITALRGAGPRLSAAAAELHLSTLGDLLLHVPHRYLDRSEIRELAGLRTGEQATVEVEVRSVRVRPTRKRRLRIVEAGVADRSGPMTAIWFNQAWIADRLAPGTRLLLSGKLERDRFRVAEYEFVEGGSGRHTTGIVPVHPAGEGLTPKRIRDWASQVGSLARHAIEPLPAELRARRRLAGAADALAAVHFPEQLGDAERARERLAFEELFLHQAALAARRQGRRARRPGVDLGSPGELVADWLGSLPFELTGDQRAAVEEIDGDLARPEPMQRLLMGEVGSGKTVLALFAMLRAVESGYQAALMAPTETLADQHAATLDRLLAQRPLPFALLTSATPAARRREALARLASGELRVVVGTHALIDPEVAFRGLAVCVDRKSTRLNSSH